MNNFRKKDNRNVSCKRKENIPLTDYIPSNYNLKECNYCSTGAILKCTYIACKIIIIIIRRKAWPPTCRVRRPFAVRRNSGCPKPRPTAASCCWIADENPDPGATVYAARTRLRELNGWRPLDRGQPMSVSGGTGALNRRGRAKNYYDVVGSLLGGVSFGRTHCGADRYVKTG
ncbi:hypothetical protein ACI65C_012581 [Semiaphis heraclei]